MSTVIKKLTLQGFKSFNKKISIPFSSNLNVICGPNGSGKSNLTDAICFVLGRTSAKSLRAERLHQLIFHGSDKKAPAQYASVTLYLDNSNKIFPFEEEEISITRKVNRKGVSVYKIQGRTRTRENILELLSSARIYPDGHNILLQGEVTNIIEMNPIERRSIIDEISGIAEYNEKKEKAQRDLDAVDQKLKEAEIVITERYEIFKKLEEERNAALKYQELQKKLQILKASLAYRKMKNIESLLSALEESIKKNEEDAKKVDDKIGEIERRIEEGERGIEKLAKDFLKISKGFEIEKEASILRTKIMVNRDKINANKNEIQRLESLISKLRDLEEEKPEEVPRSVRTILGLNLNGIYGTLKSLIKVPEKYEVAVEVALGSHSHDIVVENDEIAKYCIEFLKREKIGRATFIPLNKIRTGEIRFEKRSGIIGKASDLVKYEKKFLPAVEFALGSTLIVENLDVARVVGIGKYRMVTLEGDLIEKSGLMTGGYLIRSYPKLAREIAREEVQEYLKIKMRLEEEIKILEKEIGEMEKRLEEISKKEEMKEIVNLQDLKLDSQMELEKLREERRKLYEKRISLQSDLNKFNVQKAKLEAELENLKIEVLQYGEMEYVDKGVKALEDSIKSTFEELTKLGAVNFKAIEQFEKFKSEFDEYKRKYEKILEEKKAVL
ncbi:MAG: AAA family ATPase, partial [Candidatus Aenigmatarchaeota archaeon]